MHKLITIGDSLAMGFMSGAIYHTDRSFPVMLAKALGASEEFSYPDFSDGKGIGGLPLNLEFLLNNLSHKFPWGIKGLKVLLALLKVQMYLDRVERCWENDGRNVSSGEKEIYNNLAVLTFGVNDAYMVSEGVSSRNLPKSKDNFLLFSQVPEMPIYRAARRTLNPTFAGERNELTQVESAKKLAVKDGIENLIVFIGSNNCLGAIIDMELKYSTEADMYKWPHQRQCNLWLPKHFSMIFKKLADEIKQIGVENVYIGTIPYVTIPPVSRGWSERRNELFDGYFEYYTRPWIWDSVFNPKKDAKITREQIRLIDMFINEYNEVIKTTADKNGWIVIDTNDQFQRMAYRRNKGKPIYKWPEGAVNALQNNPDTKYLINKEDGTVGLDTRYLRLWDDKNDKKGIRSGGLFSLDGVHPTTICYGLIADSFLNAMINNGVQRIGGGIPKLDWQEIVKSDALITNPPMLLKDLRKLLKFMSGRATGKLLLRLLEKFKGNV